MIKFTSNVRHFKYQRTKQRIFFSFLHPYQELREALLTEPVFYSRPSNGDYDFAGDVNNEQDVIVHLIDMHLPWARNKYDPGKLINFFCRIPIHTITIEYNFQDDTQKTQAFYLHLRCKTAAFSMEGLTQNVSELTVGIVKESV